MAKKVSSVSKMSAVNKFKNTKNTSIAYPKLKLKEDPVVFKNLPTDGGNGLGEYVLNVMKLD
jgi:hypothetical protein